MKERRGTVVSWREWRFVLLVGALVLAVASVPYILGAALATEERIFGGFVYGLEDSYSYLAKMRQGAQGAWLFHIAYTSEPHRGAFFFPFHLLLGKIAALLPLGDLTTRMVWVYHAARVLCGLGLLLTIYRFIAEFIDHIAVRRLAWLMTATGGGLGWLLVAIGRPGWLGSMPLDFILPEGFTFLVLFAFPHIALARALLLGGILFLLRAWQSGGVSRALGGALRVGVCWLAAGLVVPFYVPVAWAVAGAAWVVLCARRCRLMMREAGVTALAAFVSAPVVAYSLWMFSVDPVYRVWSAQNLILSPHPLHYALAYGALALLAAFAARDAWRSERPLWLALAWVGVAPLLVYAPFNLQRRLVEGVQVPLAILAAMGLWKIAHFRSRIAAAPSRLSALRPGLVIAVALTALALTNVLLVAGSSLTLRGLPAPIYRDGGEVAALDWLSGRMRPDDVALSAYETGNYLPARVGARVFVGHGPETVRFGEKKALAARFFDAATDDAWRCALLADYGVDVVFWGPAERALGAVDLNQTACLRVIYEVDEYVIFEVQ